MKTEFVTASRGELRQIEFVAVFRGVLMQTKFVTASRGEVIEDKRMEGVQHLGGSTTFRREYNIEEGVS